MNNKSKMEQLFIILCVCTVAFGLLCVVGCGGGCQHMACSTMSEEGMDAYGLSLPGCGGCLSSGEGCDSCLWMESCKMVGGCIDTEEVEEEESTEVIDGVLAGCDIRYYGGGCMGCSQQEKTCYNGVMDITTDEGSMTGCFYGSSDSEEKMMGCYNGNGGCVGSNRAGAEILSLMELGTGVN